MLKALEELLKERSISRYRLAKETGISQNTIGDWIKGTANPGAASLSKVANYLGVTTDYLLGYEEKETPTPDNESERSELENDLLDIARRLNTEHQRILLKLASSMLSE